MSIQDIIKYFRKIVTDGENTGSQTDTAYRLYNNAILLIKVGRLEEARRDLKDAIKRAPGFDDAYMLLGMVHFELGNRIESIKSINQITDGAKHSQAMKFYDMLCRDTDEGVEGTFTDAGDESSDERRARQNERMYGTTAPADVDQNEKDKPEATDQSDRIDGPQVTPWAGFGDVLFELDEGVNFASSENAGRIYYEEPANKEQFDTRFKQARKSAEQGRANIGQSRNTQMPPRRPAPSQNGQLSPNQNSRIGRETRRMGDGNEARPERANVAPQTSRTNERPAVARPADPGARQAGARVQADESGRRQTRDAQPGNKQAEGGETANKDTSGANKKAILVLVIIICVALIVALSALAVKLHTKNTEKNKPSPTTAPYSGETTTPITLETPTGMEETETPTETPTPEVTATPEPPTEVPTATPDMEAELVKQQTAKLAEAKKLFQNGNYLGCFELIIGTDWSKLDKNQVAEKDELAEKSLDLFSREYKSNMYLAVRDEKWSEVLKYAETIIKYNPDWVYGDAVYFHAGKAAELTGDKVKAEQYYNDTITRYPDSQEVTYAKYRLEMMLKG